MELPRELYIEIALYLTDKEMINFGETCWKIYKALESEEHYNERRKDRHKPKTAKEMYIEEKEEVLNKLLNELRMSRCYKLKEMLDHNKVDVDSCNALEIYVRSCSFYMFRDLVKILVDYGFNTIDKDCRRLGHFRFDASKEIDILDSLGVQFI